MLAVLNFFRYLHSFLQVQESEEKNWGQQNQTVHVPMLIESAVDQFCGNVVTHEDGPKWKRRVRKMRELKQGGRNEE